MSDTTHSHADARENTLSQLSGVEYASQPNAIAVPGFELLNEVGRGGMGIVWRARDLALGREVAIKILQDRYNVDSPVAERFLEEAQITAQLQHPGIPAIYAVGHREDRRPYLAMKLIKGQTLEELLKEKKPINTLAIFEAIAQAVGYAHAHGVIHRDLKPSNVMVGTFGEVQVMDWGLAKVLSVATPEQISTGETLAPTVIKVDAVATPTQAGSVLGTPAFMAPEQAIGLVHQTDARADVFGLGGILCCMLTGSPPYIGTDNESTRELAAHAKLDDAFSRLAKSGASPALVKLCEQCLSKEKADRPANGEAVAKSVARLREDAEERARSAELEAARSEARRRTMKYAGGALAAVLSLGIIGTTRGMLEAQSARELERAAKIDAGQKRRLAEENAETIYGLTINLTDASEKLLPYVPEANRLRRKLTDQAVDAFGILLRQRPDTEAVRRWSGRFLLYQGNLRRLLGDYAAAEQSYANAAPRLKDTEGHHEVLLALTRDEAALRVLEGKLDQAEQKCKSAVAASGELIASHRENVPFHRQRAWCSMLQAQIHYRRREFAKCLAVLDEARTSLDRVLEEPPARWHVYDSLLKLEALRWRIAALRESQHAPETLALIDEGRMLIRDWTDQKESRIPVDDRNLAQLNFEAEAIQAILTGLGPGPQATAAKQCDLFIRLAENLHRRHPDVPHYRELLGRGYLLRCRFQLHQKKTDLALDDARLALQSFDLLHKDFPENVYWNAERCYVVCHIARLTGNDAAFSTSREGLRQAYKLRSEEAWFITWGEDVDRVRAP